ncbi:MAG: bacteriophage Gp15 family protein [Oscillospiraceae bacterium]|nr:bacteriophage Gp15 family protein [Oscillospiraceae bacterium]
MYNAMLDRLPEDYNGWLIRTDYRIGVQIQLCISDPDLSDTEKTWTALNLLYGNGIPDMETALAGLSWFLSCGSGPSPQDDGGNDPPMYSFEMDAGRIVSGFRKVFGIDISRERLHWFEFISMIGDLQDTAFTSVVGIRGTDPSDVDKKRRAEFVRMKDRFALSRQFTEEERADYDEFMSRLK